MPFLIFLSFESRQNGRGASEWPKAGLLQSQFTGVNSVPLFFFKVESLRQGTWYNGKNEPQKKAQTWRTLYKQSGLRLINSEAEWRFIKGPSPSSGGETISFKQPSRHGASTAGISTSFLPRVRGGSKQREPARFNSS